MSNQKHIIIVSREEIIEQYKGINCSISLSDIVKVVRGEDQHEIIVTVKSEKGSTSTTVRMNRVAWAHTEWPH